MRHDPQNPLYRLSLAATYFRQGRFGKGEDVLAAACPGREPGPVSPSMEVFGHRDWRNVFLLKREFGAFERAVGAGCLHASLHFAYKEYVCGRLDEANAILRDFGGSGSRLESVRELSDQVRCHGEVGQKVGQRLSGE